MTRFSFESIVISRNGPLYSSFISLENLRRRETTRVLRATVTYSPNYPTDITPSPHFRTAALAGGCVYSMLILIPQRHRLISSQLYKGDRSEKLQSTQKKIESYEVDSKPFSTSKWKETVTLNLTICYTLSHSVVFVGLEFSSGRLREKAPQNSAPRTVNTESFPHRCDTRQTLTFTPFLYVAHAHVSGTSIRTIFVSRTAHCVIITTPWGKLVGKDKDQVPRTLRQLKTHTSLVPKSLRQLKMHTSLVPKSLRQLKTHTSLAPKSLRQLKMHTSLRPSRETTEDAHILSAQVAETTEDAHILSAQVAETAESPTTSYSQNACSSISLASTPKKSRRRLILDTNPKSSSKPAFTTSRSIHSPSTSMTDSSTSPIKPLYTPSTTLIGKPTSPIKTAVKKKTKNKPPLIAHTLIDHQLLKRKKPKAF
ncbi:hypothetical protein PoB_006277300 [Plakobranchus ocellatus]|uniref:Uncharacterized protein n=1 Tax=Plakobranchus ocellatus TaxID=259542 RepID=A0AAV4CWM2_9GAST|nr:hypothetical protein PoB_006277300 [Plakobranchus ocellatus]